MYFKYSLVVLALISQVDAAWKETPTVFNGGTAGTTYKQEESSFSGQPSSKVKKYGYVNKMTIETDRNNNI